MNIKSNIIKFFVDDTMLDSIVNDPDISYDDLSNDLIAIQRWAYQWEMKFYPDPTKPAIEVLFFKPSNGLGTWQKSYQTNYLLINL